MKERRIAFFAIAAVIVSLALLSACGSPAATTPATTPTTSPAATPPATTTAVSAPLIPHSLEGRDNCLACHQTGVGDAPAVPADHAGRTNDICLTCHKTA
jgi:hypothetical protein